jgi:hypothetical protein
MAARRYRTGQGRALRRTWEALNQPLPSTVVGGLILLGVVWILHML